MEARGIILNTVARAEDAQRLLTAFDMVWKKMEPRAGDPELVGNKLAHILISIGNRRPNLHSAELAKIAARMFEAPSDQK